MSIDYEKDTVIEKILSLCDGMTKKDALDVLSIVSSKINRDSVYLHDRKNITHQEASQE